MLFYYSAANDVTGNVLGTTSEEHEEGRKFSSPKKATASVHLDGCSETYFLEYLECSRIIASSGTLFELK